MLMKHFFLQYKYKISYGGVEKYNNVGLFEKNEKGTNHATKLHLNHMTLFEKLSLNQIQFLS